MKKLYFLLCLVFTTVAGFGQLVYEPFNYTPSATLGLHELSGGVWQKLNSGDSMLVTAGSLNYSALTASTGNRVKFDGSGTDYFRQFGTQTTGTVYASFLLNITALGTLNSTTGGYFAAYTEGTTSTNIGAAVWVKASGTTQYNLGISTRSSSTTTFSTTNLDLNTTYLVVIAYQINSGTQNDVAMLWINPTTLGGTAPTADITAVSPSGTTSDLASVGRFQLRQDNATNTPFVEFDELRVGLDYASVTPPAAVVTTPSLTTGTLTAFGDVCTSTTAGPNSFTISGSNLTTANVTVGPLAGYSFSTTAGGTYTPSLTITQAGGTFSQTVYVNFTPTAVQSYSGNIPVGGGGATTTNVAASGNGVGATLATVATAASSGVSTTGITLNGTLSSTGCASVTSYGFIYSTTTGFNPATSGTTIASTNLSGTAFSAALTGLAPNTTYYYVAFATNSAGTAYSTQAQFTTSALPLPVAPVATAATNVTSTGFTANWNAVTGATGYFLDVYTQGPGTVVGGRVAGWDMPTATDASRFANGGNAANINVDELVAVNGQATVTYTYPSGPNGSAGSPNPFAISATNWDAGVDTKYWMIGVNTTGVTNLTISSLQGSSNGGPKDWKVQYRVGNTGSWIDVTGGAYTVGVPTAGTPATFNGPSNLALPSAADNQALVQIRWVVTSTLPVSGTAVTSGGTNRISAIYVKGNYAGTVNTYVLQNQNVGNVTSYNVTGLTPNTTYFYVVRAVDAGGTSANSNEITVTTANATPPAITTTTLADFGNVCLNTASPAGSFTINGTNLSTADVTVGPLAGYTFSTTSGGTYSNSLTLTQAGGTYSQQVFVKLTPGAVQSYNGNIPVSGGGLTTTVNVAATGAGINTAPTVTTGAASGVTTTAATLAGVINTTGCSAISAYGISYSTTAGFAPASGTIVAGSNLSGGNFSVTLSGLTPNTTYYYVAYATNGGGTVYGTQQSFTTSINPSLSAGALAGFGSVCVNTTSSDNSFTITGSNLTNANVTVGPLAGYTFSTTSGGTYTSSLNLTQPGGAYSQQVFVKFTPTSIQSYNGNIPVAGGGVTTAINVAVTGAGVSTPPSVPTAAASAITTTSATITGNVSSTGCSAITAYGVVYSTNNGFNPTTSGTTVNGTTITSGSFPVSLTGLTPATTYYYVVFVTNAAGTTVYSGQQSFTTLTPSITATALTGFGNVCLNTASNAGSFTISGTNLTTADVTVGPLAGYTFSTTSGGTYTNSLTLTQPGGSYSQTVFVKLTPTAVQSYSGNIPVSGGGVATAVNVAATGAGVNTAPTVTTAAAAGVATTIATIPGTITSNGCSNVTAYGAVYSTTNGFNPASAGTTVAGTGLTAGNFSVNLTSLLPGTTYYYVTFATNAGGTAYSTQGSFTTASAAIPVAPVATAATAINSTGFMANWNAVTGATGYFLDVYTMGSGSGSTTIAGWDMAVNTVVAQTANQGNANNINIQTLTTNTGGVLSYPSGYSGTTGTPNPYSVSSNTWAGGAGTKYWLIDVNTLGATSLNLSFNQGGSSTGPRDFKIQYRVGAAGTWTDVPGGTVTIPGVVASPGTPATWAVVSNLPLPAAAENQPLVSIRWLMTSETSISGATVAATGTDRISGIYVKSGTGTATPVYVTGYQNLSVGNVTSFNVTGLAANTTYYYVVRAANAAGTSPNSNEISVATVSGPSLTATTLTAFGNQCPNTTSAANSFTINGSNLSNANITVGPLAGYAFSTTAGGTYTPSLSLTQAGGTYSQAVFVQFTPTAVQSYNGNIPVSGGGITTAINVAATGAGVNNAPAVTTGAASAVTNTTATLAGTITNNGCTAVSAYGFEWSTTSGFANGTGTQVASTNASGGAFTSGLTGLTANTIYYYKAFATNAGGTTYGTEQSFTTAAGPVISLTASTLNSFGNVCVGTTAAPASFTITGTNLTNAPVTVAALSGFSFATTAAGPYTSTLTLNQPGGAYSQNVFVQFAPTAAQAYGGNIAISGGGAAATFNVSASGTGVATPPSPVTGDSLNIAFDRVTLRGSVSTFGCSALTEVGIEYSAIPNFTAGTGIPVAAAGVPTGASFAVTLTNLVPGTTYYYRAYARNAGAVGYGDAKSITLPSLLAGVRVFPQPVASGQSLRITMNGIQPGNYGMRLYSSAGEEVVRRFVNVQATFINERLSIPAHLPSGVYVLRLTSDTEVIAHQTIVITH
jgi:phosphodiesterase/alkaline phosphatase D-like protein